MDNKRLGELLTKTLAKYGFKSYGGKLFYLDLPDSIVILDQRSSMGASALYLRLIIKACHPEISKISKSILQDEMLIDSYWWEKLLYRSEKGYKGYGWNLYEISEKDFEAKIDEIYSLYIQKFCEGVINGIQGFHIVPWHNKFELYRDSAEAIGHPELAGYRGHDWLVSDWYLLVNKYKIDIRYVNDNTASYLMENVIKKAPEELSGKAKVKWCNEKCKELLLVSGKRVNLCYDAIFPFVDGKPLKYCGMKLNDDGHTEIYLNEDTGERFHYIKKKRTKTILNVASTKS